MWNDEEFVNELMNAEKLPKLIEDWKKERKTVFIILLICLAALPVCFIVFGSGRFGSGFGGGILAFFGLPAVQTLFAVYRQDSKIKLALLIQKLRERNELSASSEDVHEVSSVAG